MSKSTKKFRDDESVKDNSGKEKKRNWKNFVVIFLEIFFIVVMIASGREIFLWFQENRKSSETLEEISSEISIDETKEEDDTNRYVVNFNELKNRNSDTVAWLKVNGTNIEYPVVRAKDNSYYLTHSFDKSYNGAGWIFADFRDKFDGEDKNIVVYGHNRKDRSMFGSLKNVLNKEWYEDEKNRKILFYTENEQCVYEVFSIYKVKSEDYYIKTSFTDEGFLEFLDRIKKRSIYNFDAQLNSETQVLTLSTCDSNNEYRLVVHARKV